MFLGGKNRKVAQKRLISEKKSGIVIPGQVGQADYLVVEI